MVRVTVLGLSWRDTESDDPVVKNNYVGIWNVDLEEKKNLKTEFLI